MADKLTQAIVRELDPPPGGNRITYDAEVKGFGVRVTAQGTKSFVLNYRTRSGRERCYTIGAFPSWSVSAAREEASRLKDQIRINGLDPLRDIEAERGAPTVADLAARYIEEHLPSKRPSSQSEDRAMIDRLVLPELKHFKVAEVDFADIAALHRKITKAGRPVRANRVLALLSKMFSLSVLWKMRPDNPCKGVKRNAEEGRERYLEPKEIARLMKALVNHEDREAANAVMLALLTGARRAEILRATWDQFDLDKGTWTKPSAHTKQKRPHRVPLSREALHLLTKMRGDGAERHLFPGRINPGGRVDIRRPWEQVCMAAGLANLGTDGRIKPTIRFHDLRHSYASMLVGSGLSLPIIGKLLGHTQAQTTLRYAHLADDPLREATERVGKLVSGGRR